MKNVLNILNNRRKEPGIVLLVTLVLLVVLSTLGYTLTSRVAAQRHRNQYIIDYSNARYGCDSAVKYALATLEELEPQLISRPNEPDFSDLFALDAVGIQELLAEWEEVSQKNESRKGKSPSGTTDGNDLNDSGRDKGKNPGYDSTSPEIRGPYGPAWPFVTQPSEFEIGPAKVKIEIEDENAKYPLGWAILADKEQERELQAGFVTFCELAGLKSEQITALSEQLAAIAEIKPFKIDFKPITKSVQAPVTSVNSKSRTSTRTTRTRQTYTKTIPVSQQVAEQTSHFAKLFHSSLIDVEMLARPTIETENRKESPLKYIGMWGSQKVNINTAPRHVLEAAFIFGGNEVDIAEQIIQLRRENPFAEVADLKEGLSRYSDSIAKCEKYITTKSNFFTVKITAISGVAKVSSIIAITKEGQTVTRIAVING